MNPPTASATALVFTGERFTPESRGAIWYEHWHRYCAVAKLAHGRIVLDAACGEGYGSALLAQSAASVTGLDVDGQALRVEAGVGETLQRFGREPGLLRFVHER